MSKKFDEGYYFKNDVMSERPKSFGQMYVYYNSLNDEDETERNRQLYNIKKNMLYKAAREVDYENIAAKLLVMARNEAKKELAVLEKNFGYIGLNADQLDTNFYKSLIEGLNDLFNIKEVFERNVKRIEKNQAQVDITRFFLMDIAKDEGKDMSYFMKHWKDYLGVINNEITNIHKTNRKISIGESTDIVLSKYLPIIIKETYVDLLTTRAMSNGEEKERDAYKLLVEAIERGDNSANRFLRSVYDIYNMDAFKDEVVKMLSDANLKKDRTQKLKSIKSKNFKLRKRGAVEAGLTSEAMAEFILANVAKGLKGVEMTGNYATGATKQKADIAITYNFDPSVIEDLLLKNFNNFGERLRERNIERAEEINNKLQKIDEGFLVYVNAKNYQLGKNFQGFGAGSAIDMYAFGAATKKTHLIENIINLIPDTIGEDLEPDIKILLTQYIGQLLFDDIRTIGTINNKGTHTLHLLYLDGIYLPISLLYKILSDSFKSIQSGSAFNGHIKVELEYPSAVMYPKSENDYYNYQMWKEQRDYALIHSKISIKFLTNFKSLITSLFG